MYQSKAVVYDSPIVDSGEWKNENMENKQICNENLYKWLISYNYLQQMKWKINEKDKKNQLNYYYYYILKYRAHGFEGDREDWEISFTRKYYNYK